MEAIGLPLPWGLVPAERVWETWTVANPAAGADWSIRVPGGEIWVVQGFRATIVASAAVANREPRVAITDGEVQVGLLAMNTGAVTASQTRDTGGLLGGIPGGSGGTVGPFVGLPPIALQPSWTFGMSTLGLQAADQWSAIRGWVTVYNLRGLERAVDRYAEAMAEVGGAIG